MVEIQGDDVAVRGNRRRRALDGSNVGAGRDVARVEPPFGKTERERPSAERRDLLADLSPGEVRVRSGRSAAGRGSRVHQDERQDGEEPSPDHREAAFVFSIKARISSHMPPLPTSFPEPS